MTGIDMTGDVLVKICCIGSVDEAETALAHGADALGLVSEMPSGPGVVDESVIKYVAEHVGNRTKSVLLTSLGDPVAIADQVKRTRTNAVQLCTWLDRDARRELRNHLPRHFLMQVIHVTGPEAVSKAVGACDFVDAILLDSGTLSGETIELGGTGRTHDWASSRKIRDRITVPLFLAGGLNPDNVVRAIETVRPAGVDVCSGVRTKGKLDPVKLERFFANMKSLVCLLASFAVAALSACSPASDDPMDTGPDSSVDVRLEEQASGTRALLIGVSPADEYVVWVSGTGGTVARTTDGGSSWKSMVVPGADSIQFRDVHAVDAQTAYVLSAGTGPASRIYKTTNGGADWDLQFQNEGSEGFFDCMDFWDPASGIAFSDQVDGEFILIRTTDGGANWVRVPPESVPDASPGEGSFAASGRCVMVAGDSTGYIGTGGGSSGRLLKTTDRGSTWEVFETPIHDGTPTSGISSLSWVDENIGYAFGLELTGRDSLIDNAIQTLDGGISWTTLNAPQLPDVYGGAHVPGHDPSKLFVAGPKGIDFSIDGGESWTSLTKLDHWGIAFVNSGVGWAVGPGGRITKINLVSYGHVHP